MELARLPEYLRREFTYPVTRHDVLAAIGDREIDAPDRDDTIIGPPMIADDLARLDNQPERIDEKALARLQATDHYLITHQDRADPEFDIEATDANDQWRITFPDDLVIGQL